ncbi:hypothetical protein [Azoarcus olearius]|uniref:Uncharacterized protein n=1 Tax=Azoarcus sp. (strain BH72) TaxID=418699 RepID=A1K1H6_AZOSB|nr:hypothetical protein [Azoarcus olearius]ANQ83156.1 hypothetical protein dqs_0073 [Azoarcus olearius]CAL92681.1 hypothetical protein azo0063 [Azoarcus olearius]
MSDSSDAFRAAGALPIHPATAAVPAADIGRALWCAGLLGNLHDAGVAISLCTSGWDQAAFFESRAARKKALQCLNVMVDSARDLPDAVTARLGRIDWLAWEALRAVLKARTADERDRLWYAIGTLVPATVIELRRYRRQMPQLFEFSL